MDIDHRIGFDERDEATRRLSEHHAAGRLEIDEFEERVDLALKARTIGDLIDIFHDLPDEDWMIQPDEPAAAVAPRPSEGRTVTQEVPVGDSHAGYLIMLLWVVALLSWMAGITDLALAMTLGAAILTPVIHGFGKGLARTRTIRFVEGDAVSEVRALLEIDHKILAIKRWRELHPGVGLAEAKNAVETIERGGTPPQLGR